MIIKGNCVSRLIRFGLLPLAGLFGISLALTTSARAQAPDAPSLVVYSNGYMYNSDLDAWWWWTGGDQIDAPADPGDASDSTGHWDMYQEEGIYYAQDWYDWGQWATYDSDTDEWIPSGHRPTDYLYYTESWAYDDADDTWYDETLSGPGGDWGPDAVGPYDTVYLLGGQNWEYYDDGTAYDTYTDTWYYYDNDTDSYGSYSP